MAKTYCYRVTQTIDIEIGTPDPVKAAELARKIQLDPLTEANFEVEMVGICPSCHRCSVHTPRCSVAKKNDGIRIIDFPHKVVVLGEYRGVPDAG